MAVNQPPPYPRAPIGLIGKDPLTGESVANLTTRWSIYFRDQRQYLAQIPVSVTPEAVTVPDANDTVATTTITTPENDGVFSFEYYLRVITAAGVSSSATVVLGWTDQTQALSKPFTAVAGNTTTTHGSERYQFNVDGGTPITYSVTYASNPVNAMHYNLYIVVSAVAGVTNA